MSVSGYDDESKMFLCMERFLEEFFIRLGKRTTTHENSIFTGDQYENSKNIFTLDA